MFPVPAIVRRFWRLFEARRALVEGAPEDALAHLRDPALALSERADHLRLRAMDVLFRNVATRHSEGRDSSVARLLTVAASEDPLRAEEWRRRLEPERSPLEGPGSAMRELLAEMRGRGERPPSEPRERPLPPLERVAPPAGEPLRFHLAVDDGGEFLVVSGSSVTIGHARAGRADVPLLADLESLHARLDYSASFHGGPRWRVEPLGHGARRGAVSVAQESGEEQPVEESRPLADGDQVRLAPNVLIRFRRPEPASASAILELGGVEAEGAQRVLLFVPGSAGRVRIGSKAGRHVTVTGVEHEVELTLECPEELNDRPTELHVRCAGGVRVLGVDARDRPAQVLRALPCPPSARADLVLGARPSLRAPFGLSLAPIDPPTMPGGTAR